jgi:DNA-binding LytR/AlgR family response regulator
MKVVIIEDEEAAAQRLQKILLELDPSIEILNNIDSIEKGVSFFSNSRDAELIFADIQLADGPSFEIFSRTQITTPVIFITAYDNFAIQAFRFNGIDYLLKPVKKPDVQLALEKYKNLKAVAKPAVDYQELLATLSGKKNTFQKRIIVRIGQSIRTIEIVDVAYFYTEEKIAFACLQDGKRMPLDFTLDELENILDPSLFFRINRQFIIFIKSIESMSSYSKSRIKIILKPAIETETIVSAERSADFKEWLLGK